MTEEIKDEINVEDIELETDEGIELEESDEELETEETETEETETEEEPEREPEPEKTVPLKALEAERNKWKNRLNDPSIKQAQALAERLRRSTGKDVDTIMAEIEAAEAQRYAEQGVDPAVAQELLAIRRQNDVAMSELKRQKRDMEFETLKAQSLYADIDLYRDEVEEQAERTGGTLKSAYLELHGERRYQEMEREVEQRVMNNQAKKQSKKIDTTPTGETKAKERVKYTPEQEWAAKAAGMSIQEYLAMGKIRNQDQYRKVNKK